MGLFWQFFLLNIKPFARTLLKRFFIHMLICTFLLFVMILLIDQNMFSLNIFLLCGFIPFLFSEYALRMDSSFINIMFSWGYKRIYSYFLCKYLFAILIAFVYTLLLYLALPIGMEKVLGCAFISIGVMLCVGILTIPYNKNKLDLFDDAAFKGNTGSKKITFIRIIFLAIVHFILIPMLEGCSENLYLIYFVIGATLTLLTPLWVKIAVNKIIKNKYNIIDSLTR